MKYLVIVFLLLAGCTTSSSKYQSSQFFSGSHFNEHYIYLERENADSKKTNCFNSYNNYYSQLNFKLNNINNTLRDNNSTLLSLIISLNGLSAHISATNTIIKNEMLSKKNIFMQPISNQQTQTKNSSIDKGDEKSIYEFVDKFLCAIAAYILFLWGLMVFALSEAKAKFSIVSPLIAKASESTDKAERKNNTHTPINDQDIQDIIKPLLQAVEILKDEGLADFIAETNKNAVNLTKNIAPDNLKNEIYHKNLLINFTLRNMNSLSQIRTCNRFFSQYKIVEDKLFRKNKKTSDYWMAFKKAIFAIIATGLLSFYLMVIINEYFPSIN